MRFPVIILVLCGLYVTLGAAWAVWLMVDQVSATKACMSLLHDPSVCLTLGGWR